MTATFDTDYGPRYVRLRQEAREWLEASAPEELVGVTVPRRPDPELAARIRSWGMQMAAGGWVCVSWPREVGGRGLSAIGVAVLEEEFARAGVPRVTRGMGEGLVGPSIIAHGTDQQKAYFLPRIIDGTDRYCQGFSEPDAGSDLASLRTTGLVDGDELVVSGQKVWTSWYWDATTLFCLCRTDPDAPRHRGISYALLPIRREDGSPNGIEFRPLRQLGGDANFAATYLDGARTPLFNVIGTLGSGWNVAMTTLGNERGGRTLTQHVNFERQFWKVVEELRNRDRLGDPLVRQFLARSYTTVTILRAQGQRLAGQLLADRSPGPEANPSLNKMLWSESQQRMLAELMTLLGNDAVAADREDSCAAWRRDFYTSRSDTIWGGTAQIQRNILAERVLGLPREPRKDS